MARDDWVVRSVGPGASLVAPRSGEATAPGRQPDGTHPIPEGTTHATTRRSDRRPTGTRGCGAPGAAARRAARGPGRTGPTALLRTTYDVRSRLYANTLGAIPVLRYATPSNGPSNGPSYEGS